jgi:endonuclease-3
MPGEGAEAYISRIIDRLTGAYGVRRWEPDHRPLDSLVRTILSQNTSDTNSGRAFQALLSSFPDWENVVAAEAGDIARVIRSGGMGQVKARHIKQALAEIRRQRGRLELDFLNELPLGEARDWLLRLPGVGRKTAGCVLLFALGRPALPVDTHVFRVARRLGLVPDRTSIEQAHFILEDMVPADRVYQFHVLLIEHGRKICIARRPRCTRCALGDICPSYELFTGQKKVQPETAGTVQAA